MQCPSVSVPVILSGTYKDQRSKALSKGSELRYLRSDSDMLSPLFRRTFCNTDHWHQGSVSLTDAPLVPVIMSNLEISSSLHIHWMRCQDDTQDVRSLSVSEERFPNIELVLRLLLLETTVTNISISLKCTATTRADVVHYFGMVNLLTGTDSRACRVKKERCGVCSLT